LSADDAFVFSLKPFFDALSMIPVHAVDVSHVIAAFVELFGADGTLFDQILRRCLYFVDG